MNELKKVIEFIKVGENSRSKDEEIIELKLEWTSAIEFIKIWCAIEYTLEQFDNDEEMEAYKALERIRKIIKGE